MKKEIDYGQLLKTPEFENRADKFVKEVSRKYEDCFLFFCAENYTKELPKRLIKGSEAFKSIVKDNESDQINEITQEGDVNQFIDKFVFYINEHTSNRAVVDDIEKSSQKFIRMNDLYSVSENEVEIMIYDNNEDCLKSAILEIINIATYRGAEVPYLVEGNNLMEGCQIYTPEEENVNEEEGPYYSVTLNFFFKKIELCNN